MPSMRAVPVTSANGPFEMVEREIPQPGPRQVRVKVQACGVCHSDLFTKEGDFPGVTYPRVPGHEVVGVSTLSAPTCRMEGGSYVGVGWLGYCGYCDSCRRDDLSRAKSQLVTGITMDGGYPDYVTGAFEGLALVPEDQSCRGRAVDVRGHHHVQLAAQQRARAGPRVAVLGIGGLGHLAVQFASRMGFLRLPSHAAPTRSRWRGSSVRAITLTAPLVIRPRNCSNWAAPP